MMRTCEQHGPSETPSSVSSKNIYVILSVTRYRTQSKQTDEFSLTHKRGQLDQTHIRFTVALKYPSRGNLF